MINTSMLIAGLLAANASMPPGCPLPQLANALQDPPAGVSKIEIPISPRSSTEGGHWEIVLGHGNAARAIIRTDYGETGRREVTLVILDPGTFALRRRVIEYRAPLSAGVPPRISSETVTDYFVCGDIAYVPVSRPLRGAAVSLRAEEVEALIQMFFGAKELKPYLRLE